LKNAEHLTWQWALEELLEIHAQTIVPLDSMMVPDDYLQRGKFQISVLFCIYKSIVEKPVGYRISHTSYNKCGINY
jgi:hypothetical protein